MRPSERRTAEPPEVLAVVPCRGTYGDPRGDGFCLLGVLLAIPGAPGPRIAVPPFHVYVLLTGVRGSCEVVVELLRGDDERLVLGWTDDSPVTATSPLELVATLARIPPVELARVARLVIRVLVDGLPIRDVVLSVHPDGG